MSGTKTFQGAAWARCSDALHPLAACGSLIQRGPAHSRCPPGRASPTVRAARRRRAELRDG